MTKRIMQSSGRNRRLCQARMLLFAPAVHNWVGNHLRQGKLLPVLCGMILWLGSIVCAIGQELEPESLWPIDEPSLVEEAANASTSGLPQFRVGYDSAFVICGSEIVEGLDEGSVFKLRLNGWGQLRHTVSRTTGNGRNLNQFQLKRARLIFSGTAFTEDLGYYIQLDGRSTSGDDVRLLDYYLSLDVGHRDLGWDKGVLGIKAGRFKMPFNLARSLSGREFEFTDRSMASTYFDVNRSLALGLYGKVGVGQTPIHWETAIFNGLVTGGAETGSSGNLDTNFAYSARLFSNPDGNWGTMQMADWDWHEQVSTRWGAGYASSVIDRAGATEFNAIRVVDSGSLLSMLLPLSVSGFQVNLFSVDSSFKYHGWSGTAEYYFRTIQGIEGADLPDFFDHGFWLQLGKFVVREKVELAARWSNIQGNSGTLGANDQNASELSGVMTYYFRKQNARFTVDVTRLDGAPVDSAALDFSPGDNGWVFRSQIQFAF